MARRLAAVPETSRRAVLYIRVSALMGRSGDNFHSPEMQLAHIRRAGTMFGLREVAVVDDDIDQTGRTFQREGIERIRRLVEDGRVDVVAFYDIKRFGRNTLEGLKFAKWLDQRGIGLFSASEQIDTSTPSGRLMFTNMLSLAEYQSDEIGRYWANVRTRRGEAGLWHGSAPTGYMCSAGTLAFHPIEGPAMERAFRDFADGEAIGDLNRRFGAAVGRQSRTSTLKLQMRSRTYLGEVPLNGVWLPGKHPPLVSEELFEKVQERMRRETSMPSRSLDPTWSMIGLAVCPQGHNLQRHLRPDAPGKPKVQRLQCGHYRSAVSDACEGIGTPSLEKVEAEVLRQWRERAKLLRSDRAEQARQLARKSAAKVDVAKLKADLRRTQTAITNVVKQRAMSDGYLDDRTFREVMRDFQSSEEALLAALDEAKASAAYFTPIEAANNAEALMALWPSMTYAEKNKALRTQIKKIIVRGPECWREHESHRVKIDWY